MSEPNLQEDAAPWLGAALYRQLSPVTAPPSLWTQIEGARHSQRKFFWNLPLWASACAVLLVAVSALLAGWRVNASAHDPYGDREILALANSTNPLDFTSANPSDIRRWVKTNTGMDIELVDNNPAVELVGARVIRLRGASVAAIAYRAEDGAGTLFVSRDCDAFRRKPQESHSLLRTAGHAKQVFSWSARNQSYTIAFSNPANSRGACVLCHADSRGI